MKKKQQVVLFLLSVVFAVVIISLLNTVLTEKIPNADLNLTQRGIESPLKLLLNGYLSAFFRFSYLGNISWLLIPLSFGYYFVAKPKWGRPEFFVLTLLILALILIGAKGFFNPRYAYTIMALLVFLVFDFTWKITQRSSMPFLKYAAMIALCAIVFWNFYRQTVGIQIKAKLEERILKSKAVVPEFVDSLKMGQSVENLFAYIDTMQYDGAYLVDNIPEFYYRTNKKGVYYWNGDDMVFNKQNRWFLLKDRSDLDVSNLLIDSLNCRYIFVYKSYEDYNERFKRYLKTNCKIIAQDDSERILYLVTRE